MSRNRTEEFAIDTLRNNRQTQRSVLDVTAVHWSDIFANSEYIIPDYQRNYSWEGEHQEEFWDTILESYDEVERLPEEDDYELDAPAGAYMGTVYFARKNTDEDIQQEAFEIVDGQQRLATIQLILTVLYDYIQFYHEGEGSNDISPNLFSDLVTAKEHLDSAFDTDGNPTVKLTTGDSDYFAALAAKPERGRRTPARVEFVERRLEEDEEIDGKNAPRAKQVKDTIQIFQKENKYSPDSRSLENSLVEELEPERDEEEESEESESEEGQASEFSRRNEWIRYEMSHKRLVDMYERCYSKIEAATEDLDTDEKVYYIANLAEFILNGLTVSRCIIEVPDSTLHMDIFKSINDKGLDLHPIDLIRARIRHSLAGANAGTVVSDWNNMLSMFGGEKDEVEDMLGYYVAVRAKSIGSKSDANDVLLDYFDRRNRSSQVEAQLSGSETEIQNTVDDVLDYANYYHSMVYGDGERISQLDNIISAECKQDIQAILERIEDHIGAEQYRSLGAYACWKVSNESRIEQSEAEDFLRELFNGIEALVLRQSISERSGAATEGVFVEVTDQFAQRLEKLNNGEIIVDTAYDPDTIIEELQTTAESTVPGLFGTRMVRNVVLNSNWQNHQVRAVFHRMTEQQLRSGNIELEVRNVGELDVEHVLPQHPISDENVRTEQTGEVSEYAWLKYFFNGPDTDNSIGRAVEQLIDHEIEGLTTEAIESLDVDDPRDLSDLEDAVTHIQKRFINDIGNFIFLTKSDDRSIQNKLFSKKLPVYVYDEYGQLPTNRFFVDEDNGFNIFNNIDDIEKEDIPEDGLESMTDDNIENIDEAWNYDRLFERKRSLIPQILEALEFNDDEQEFDPDTIRSTIDEDMDTDIGEKLEQLNF